MNWIRMPRGRVTIKTKKLPKTKATKAERRSMTKILLLIIGALALAAISPLLMVVAFIGLLYKAGHQLTFVAAPRHKARAAYLNAVATEDANLRAVRQAMWEISRASVH